MRGVAVSKGALVALVALAAALPTSAAATTQVSSNGNVVRAVSDPGENNQVGIDFDADTGHILIGDDTEGVNVTAPCVLAAGQADCALSSGSHRARIIVSTGDGRDTVREGLLMILVEPFLNAEGFRPSLFKLGPGNDFGQAGFGSSRIIGGPGNDRLIGFDGPDTLIGGPGKDILDHRLSGARVPSNTGRDRYLAGPGKDRIYAHDFTRDLRISCGPGRDKLSRDRFDPRPSGCP